MYFIYFIERVIAHREEQRERETLADSSLSVQPDMGLDLMSSCPEAKEVKEPRVQREGCREP